MKNTTPIKDNRIVLNIIADASMIRQGMHHKRAGAGIHASKRHGRRMNTRSARNQAAWE